MPSLLPDGHIKAMAASVSSVSGIRMAARIQLAFFRAASVWGDGSGCSVWECECPAPISSSTSCRKLYGVGGAAPDG